MKTVLILGGTREGRELAAALGKRFGERLRIITSLAGRTAHAPEMVGEVRVGGFGGADGLAAYVKNEGVDLVVDATHPFAQTITASAKQACDQVGVARLRLDRPNWKLPENSDALYVPDLEEAARYVGRNGLNVLLTVGRQGLSAFRGLPKVHFVVRLVEEPPEPLGLVNFEQVLARPPFSVEDEVNLLKAHQIDTIVTKASGGDDTYAKLQAAAKLNVRIVLVRRPPAPDGDVVRSVEDASVWIEARL